MRNENQDQILVEFNASDFSPDDVKKVYPRTIQMRDYVAEAFAKLLEAGNFGVHFSEIRPDALARFDQLGIDYRRFHSGKRDPDTWTRNWLRLSLPRGVTARIVAAEAV